MVEYLLPIFSIIVGLAVLIAGGEALVRGASALAVTARISPLVVGLTVVAFGTSSPELAVSIQASLAGQADIAIGNVVGSNICNVLLILGLSAVVAPLVVSSRLIRFDVPVMIVVSCLLPLMALDLRIGRIDGALLFTAVVVYTAWLVVQSRRENKQIVDEFSGQLPGPPKAGWKTVLLQVGLIALGLALLAIGSRLLVQGATAVARLLELSELIVGLTIVAVGTSLPELVTSVVAALRGARDIAVGNIVGSNIFNILAVLGLAAVLTPEGVAVSRSALLFDIPVMIAVAVACLPIFFTGATIARWEGFLFLAYYVFYTAYLVLSATGSPVARTLGAVVLLYVVPLTVITLLVTVLASLRKRNGG
ncbi:MAG: calcium/sodium antiporter [Rhodopirellula sp.]|nr:calcium/sodium antiporter [Rhodopirellula sp.]